MYCLGCGYSLDALSAGPCPECSRRFDPADPSTFDPSPGGLRRRNRRWVLLYAGLALWPLLLDAYVHALLLVARLELGRWPHRMGADDPKGIPIVSTLCIPAMIAMYLSPLLFGASLIILLRIALFNGRLALALLPLVPTGLVLPFLIGDPARAWVWFMD